MQTGQIFTAVHTFQINIHIHTEDPSGGESLGMTTPNLQ